MVTKLLLLCTLLGAVGKASKDNAGSSQRIVGGELVAIGKHPYMVAMQYRSTGELRCGGTLLKPRWVLSAAHCLLPNGRSGLSPVPTALFMFVMGSHDVRTHSDPHVQVRTASRFLPHERYDSDRLVHDIGVVLLTFAFRRTPWVQTVQIADREWMRNITVCSVIGWTSHVLPKGKNPETLTLKDLRARTTNQLQRVDLPLVSVSLCREQLPYHYISESLTLCAGYDQGGRDACIGDSGSPLICAGRQAGIVSYGELCAVPRTPGIYTNVITFRAWLELHTEGGGPSLRPEAGFLCSLLVANYFSVFLWEQSCK